MNVGLYQAAAALNANGRWQDSIAQNLAAASIPGFKKQDLSFGAIAAGMKSAPAPDTHSSLATNFSPGELRFTGVKTDVALEGSGFFAVQLPDGNIGYTRDGEFQTNASGELISKQG